MAFRFLHTADWQVGKPFANFRDDAGAELRAQRIRSVERIASLARTREVDAVLIAGDAFDTNEVSDRTLHRTLEALQGFRGPWVVLPGNHDAALAYSVWTRIAEMGAPANLIVADRPEPISLGKAVVLPAPLRRRREALDQTEWFDTATTADGLIRLGLAHGSVAGRLPGASEAANEIPADRAETAGLSYLALGDWHGHLEIAPRTWYSGTHEADRHKDNRPGYVNLVEIAGPRAPAAVEPVAIGHYTWIRREIELLDGRCDAALAVFEALPVEPRRCVVSLALTGTLSLAERHRLARERAVFEARLHHLEIDETALLDEPTADDIDAIDTSGFVRAAVERLRAKAADPGDPEHREARMALRMIYLDHVGQGDRR
jgi:DNA repair exonuclease SbcCD nuclease subunit